MASSSVFNSALSVLSLNVDGLRDLLKRAALLQWLHAVPSVDVVCLQEVHCVSESECQLWFWIPDIRLVYLLVPIDLAGVLFCFDRFCFL